MKTQMMMTAAALALAACGSSADKSGGNGTAAATGGGAGVSLQPGEWEMKMEVVDVAAEGLPAGMAESMKKSASSTNRTCMTPEEAKGPKGDIFAGDKSGSCKSEGFKWDGGRIQGKMTCPGQGGTGETVMTMDGSYSPQNIDMTMKSRTDLMGKPMTMEMRVAGRRVGECTAATKEG
ncbi:MAG: DUF3617 domain-containing protein [Allosphingosinicella sp.]